MKRSPLIKKFYRLRRSKLKVKSTKRILINDCKDLLRKILVSERGAKCELSERPANRLGLFHIMPEGRYPRISLHPHNLLLVNWFPYHYLWHHDPHRKDEIESKIIRLRGENYKEDLLKVNALAPKLTMTCLNNIRIVLEIEVENLSP